ncbi:hypothetical protein BASA81_005807 [Batrachochytrium salamandrivorans]|nr:hypothetical protein BASA81_005807 [Batrachochytrium salamandrivorans]
MRTPIKDVVVGSLVFASMLGLYQYNKPVYRVTRLVDRTKLESDLSKRTLLWEQAVDETTRPGAGLTPRINFNLYFQLGAHRLEMGEVEDAMKNFTLALQAFPEGFDLHRLEPRTRRRVSVALDHLAQFHQDRKQLAQAMELYDRALDAIASPGQVRLLLSGKEPDPPLLPEHIHSLAGTLNNLATLYFDLGREQDSRACLDVSDRLLKETPMVNTDNK